MSIRVCDNCGIKNTDYPVYDIENQRNLYFCSRECFENNIKIKSKMRETYSIYLKCTLNLRKNQQIRRYKK